MSGYEKLEPSALAERLERLLARSAKSGQKRRLLHELQVHQLELELQNRELKRAQAELEESRNLYAELYDFAPVGFLSLSHTGIIRRINLHGATLLGRERAKIEGRSFIYFLAPEQRGSFARYLREVFQSRTRLSQTLRFDVGATQPAREMLLEGVVTAGAGVPICRAALIDLSESMRTHAKLREQAEQLAQADRRKNEFLAMLAHELRNPLAPIYNAVQILQRTLPDADPERQRWGLGVIARQTEHLVRLVDDLLDTARISQGRIELRKAPLVIDNVISNAVESVAPLMAERRHTLKVVRPTLPLQVDGDAVRLVQAVVNLLTNAARYTEPGGRIELTARRDVDDAVISVKDNGRGISAEALPRVFEPLYQGPKMSERSRGGLGLGLALTRELIRLHSGDVQAHSRGAGAGSEFIIRLPLLATLEAAAPTAVSVTATATVPAPEVTAALPAAEALSEKQRVLVVDDQHDVANSLVMLLQALGHEAQAAHHGTEALAVVPQFHPDVVFLDIGLPDMDGVEIARRLRKGGHRMRLVALTGFGQKPASADNGEMFETFLVKPAAVADIERVLAQSR
jgi:signal transduction histidine kinase